MEDIVFTFLLFGANKINVTEVVLLFIYKVKEAHVLFSVIFREF